MARHLGRTTARGPVTESHFLDLQQKGSAITGTTGQEKGPLKWDVRNAKFDSGKLTFDGATGDLQLGYDLQLTGDELVGTVVAQKSTRYYLEDAGEKAVSDQQPPPGPAAGFVAPFNER